MTTATTLPPRISVLMGIYNCAATLAEALDSLLAQTYTRFQVIMCDDGSTDDTAAVARSYVERYPGKFILVSNERNMGLNYTLNHCLSLADTEYCARMDGDDISLPERFAMEVDFLDRHPQYAVVSAPMIYFDGHGDYRRGVGRGDVKPSDFVRGTPICHAPCMARTAVIKAVGGYSVSDRLLRVEDYHLWFKVYAAGHRLFMLDTCLYKMRDDRNALARRNWRNRRNEAYVKHIGYRMLHLPCYYQIFCLEPIVKWLLPTPIYKFFHYRQR